MEFLWSTFAASALSSEQRAFFSLYILASEVSRNSCWEGSRRNAHYIDRAKVRPLASAVGVRVGGGSTTIYSICPFRGTRGVCQSRQELSSCHTHLPDSEISAAHWLPPWIPTKTSAGPLNQSARIHTDVCSSASFKRYHKFVCRTSSIKK